VRVGVRRTPALLHSACYSYGRVAAPVLQLCCTGHTSNVCGVRVCAIFYLLYMEGLSVLLCCSLLKHVKCQGKGGTVGSLVLVRAGWCGRGVPKIPQEGVLGAV
jgi:hypothetical protein